MNSFVIPGNAFRNACGRMIQRIACHFDIPSACAAVICPSFIEWMAPDILGIVRRIAADKTNNRGDKRRERDPDGRHPEIQDKEEKKERAALEEDHKTP